MVDKLNLSNVFKKYAGKWVAFKKDTSVVISFGDSPKSVYDRAIKKTRNPTLFKVPTKLINYIG